VNDVLYRFQLFLLRLRRNGNKTTSGLKFHARFDLTSTCSISYVVGNFENWTTISGIFSQISAVHAKKWPEFYFQSNF